MIVENYTPDDLKKLPLRAIVAWAVRCARRVEHLARLPDDSPDKERCQKAVEQALRLAEDFARSLPTSEVEAAVSEIEACRTIAHGDFVRESAMSAIVLAGHATATATDALELEAESEEKHRFKMADPTRLAHLVDITADLAARDAFAAALDAARAVGHSERVVDAARNDYEKLLRLSLGSYPEAGEPVDPSPDGPLGAL